MRESAYLQLRASLTKFIQVFLEVFSENSSFIFLGVMPKE